MKMKFLVKIAMAVVLTQALSIKAIADSYPSKPISIVVVWPAGGGHDIAARLVGQYLTEEASVPVVINNVTGAGGSTGMRAIANAERDGYTIGVMGMHAISASFMNPNAPSLGEIQPLSYIGPDPGALQVSGGSGISSLDEFIKILKREPGSVVNGNDGLGGNSYIFASVLEKELGVKMTRIPYAGHAPNVAALMSGEVMSATLPVPPIVEHTLGGKIKTLGIMAEKRHHLLPDVPTFKEQGYDIEIGDFYTLVAPKGIPEDRLKKLESMLSNVFSNQEFKDKALQIGLIIEPKGLKETEEFIAKEVDSIFEILDEGGLVKVHK